MICNIPNRTVYLKSNFQPLFFFWKKDLTGEIQTSFPILLTIFLKLGSQLSFFVNVDDPKLAARVHAFLARYGLINFGVYKVLKMPPPGKCSNKCNLKYCYITVIVCRIRRAQPKLNKEEVLAIAFNRKKLDCLVGWTRYQTQKFFRNSCKKLRCVCISKENYTLSTVRTTNEIIFCLVDEAT